jgi:hypothetical protein
MHIWVDADACPLAVKEILYRAAERAQVRMTLVANRLLGTPRSPWIGALQVARGFDVADNEIANRLAPGDARFHGEAEGDRGADRRAGGAGSGGSQAVRRSAGSLPDESKAWVPD